MPGTQGAAVHHGLHVIGQVQQAQGIGDGGSTATNHPPHIAMRERKLLDECLVTTGFVDW